MSLKDEQILQLKKEAEICLRRALNSEKEVDVLRDKLHQAHVRSQSLNVARDALQKRVALFDDDTALLRDNFYCAALTGLLAHPGIWSVAEFGNRAPELPDYIRMAYMLAEGSVAALYGTSES